MIHKHPKGIIQDNGADTENNDILVPGKLSHCRDSVRIGCNPLHPAKQMLQIQNSMKVKQDYSEATLSTEPSTAFSSKYIKDEMHFRNPI